MLEMVKESLGIATQGSAHLFFLSKLLNEYLGIWLKGTPLFVYLKTDCVILCFS